MLVVGILVKENTICNIFMYIRWGKLKRIMISHNPLIFNGADRET